MRQERNLDVSNRLIDFSRFREPNIFGQLATLECHCKAALLICNDRPVPRGHLGEEILHRLTPGVWVW
jgi:hypothetical protein